MHDKVIQRLTFHVFFILAMTFLAPTLACHSNFPKIQTGQETQGVPIGKSPFLKSGTFSYQSAELRSKKNGETIVEFVVMNGTHRDYFMVSVNVILLGANGQRASQRVPLGPIESGRNRRSVARFKELDFGVEDIVIEVVDAKKK